MAATNIQLSNGELNYINQRRKSTQSHIAEYLRRWNISTNLKDDITIGIALSGGGYRAMFTGAGVLSAFDERTPGSNIHMGRLLQASTYVAGISGGLWIVMSNYLNGHQSVRDTISQQMLHFNVPVLQGISNMDVSGLRLKLDSQDILSDSETPPLTKQMTSAWNDIDPTLLTSTLLKSFFLASDEQTPKGKDAVDLKTILSFYKDLTLEVRTKSLANFSVSFVDYWGRALIRKIVPNFEKSIGLTFSSTRINAATQPFPIICSVERQPETFEDFRSSHIFEFNPYEFGSWDSFLRYFADMEYLGSDLKNGKPQNYSTGQNSSVCVKGYDNVAFVTGTSSSLFNTLVQYVHKLLVTMDSEPTSVVALIFNMLGVSLVPGCKRLLHPEYSTISPNPFFGLEVAGRGRSISKSKEIYLADGGDDGQNIPFQPLLVPHRIVDVIFAVDGTSDLHNFPNGTSLKRTAERYHSNKSDLLIPLFQYQKLSRRIFPKTPSQEEFVSKDMKGEPIFLGCEISRDYEEVQPAELSDKNSSQYEVWPNYVPPLIILNSNNNYSFPSNTSTFQGIYNQLEVEGMLTNGYNVATSGNSTQYFACVACAITKRSAERQNLSLPTHCHECFNKYCYH